MTVPVIIDYNTFLANVQEADLTLLALLANGEVVKTLDPVEADVFQAGGVRLKQAGLLTRFRRSLENINEDEWHVFDGRVPLAAFSYVAQCATERIKFSRDPYPPA